MTFPGSLTHYHSPCPQFDHQAEARFQEGSQWHHSKSAQFGWSATFCSEMKTRALDCVAGFLLVRPAPLCLKHETGENRAEYIQLEIEKLGCFLCFFTSSETMPKSPLSLFRWNWSTQGINRFLEGGCLVCSVLQTICFSWAATAGTADAARYLQSP